MKELERGEEHPDRYKNRGGQLLKEEKERKKLQRQLTQVETKLKALSKQYSIENNGKQILVYGQTIDSYINDLNEAEKTVSFPLKKIISVVKCLFFDLY